MKIPSINFLMDLSIQKYVIIFTRISMDINHAKKRNQYPLNPIQTGMGGRKYPKRNKCLQNSENRKKLKKTTTNASNPLIEAAI